MRVCALVWCVCCAVLFYLNTFQLTPSHSQDLADKVEQVEPQLTHFGRGGGSYLGIGDRAPKKDDTQVRVRVGRTK
jgi:hypothetical protein